VRLTIWVRPGAVHPGIGGEQGGALIVRVSARAVDGRATEAALTSVARAFGVPRRAVTLVTGENDIVLFVRTRDAESLRALVLDRLQTMDGVLSTHTVLVFDEL